MNTAAIIPIKAFANVKQRLSALLNEAERAALAEAMLKDVLIALGLCQYVDEVFLVSRDRAVHDIALEFDVQVIHEPEQADLIGSVTYAASVLEDRGYDRMLFLPGDVPLVTPDELDAICDGVSDPPMIRITPASDLFGTNGLLVSPPAAIRFSFGPDSFRKHLEVAEQDSVRSEVIQLPGLGLDLDTPEDLIQLCDRLAIGETASHTLVFMTDNAMSDRLSAWQKDSK